MRASSRLAAVALTAVVAVAACGGDAEVQSTTSGNSPNPNAPSPSGPEAPGTPSAADPQAPPAGAASGESTGEAPLLEPGLGAGEIDFVGDEMPSAEQPLSPMASCASRAVEAETIERVVEVTIEEEVVVPSVFYLMLDSSGSMVSDPFTLAGLIEDVLDFFGLGRQPPMLNKWDYAVAGLTSFVNDPNSAGLELSLGYFPEGGLCDGSGYDVPSVPLGVLPENAPTLESSLAARNPTGGTPLEGALRGATRFCLGYNAEHPDASCVAVLITDGAAEQCDARSAEQLAAIAADAAERGVLTFATGMQGADFAVLDAIGQAGGGDCDPNTPGFACDLTADQGAFQSALNGIRDRTRTQTRIETHVEREVTKLPCQWEIPAPEAGEVFDPERVNVAVSLPGAEPETLSGVAQAQDCGADGGWYYDDPTLPSSIHACPSSCEFLEAQTEARVDLLFGCKTIIR
ncbi:MAG TPA: hypothetical protein VJU61_23920 [Polyangiaceae bacterium]|nr:hypothetical protein [Polyangiaceae bacterium]